MTGVELEDILSELFPSDDPLDQKDFDVNQYINSLFPNEQSLNGLEDVILEMTNRIDDLDGEVSNLVREGNQNSFESENLLNQSMEEIKELVKSINTIKTRAQVGFLYRSHLRLLDRMITCVGEWLIQPTRSLYSHQPNATCSYI